MPKTLSFFTLAMLLLTAALACAGEQAANGQPAPYPTYTPYPTYAPASSTGAQPANPQAAPNTVTPSQTTPTAPDATEPSRATAQPTDDPGLRDITGQQHRQLDQQIADLQSSPQILAECAREAGVQVPAPGSEGEAEWYGQAAVRYSACAASKTTGVDLTRGN